MRILLVAAFLAAPGALVAQQRDFTSIVDRVFSSWTAPGSPGCAVAVARGSDVLFTKGYGLADLETDRAITPETIFETGSVAKQFTATIKTDVDSADPQSTQMLKAGEATT